jgi:hypothetical protein
LSQLQVRQSSHLLNSVLYCAANVLPLDQESKPLFIEEELNRMQRRRQGGSGWHQKNQNNSDLHNPNPLQLRRKELGGGIFNWLFGQPILDENKLCCFCVIGINLRHLCSGASRSLTLTFVLSTKANKL